MEWTPLRQKPYWITYKGRKAFPKLAEGDYYRHVLDTFTVAADTSDTTGAVDTVTVVDNLYRFEIAEGIRCCSRRRSTPWRPTRWPPPTASSDPFWSPSITASAKRIPPTSFGAWEPKDGTIIVRLKDVSDTSLTLWTPAYSPEPNGFLPYGKNGK